MRSKHSYFTCNFFIFLTEDLALPLIQLLLLIFSKRLDKLLSVCGALNFIFSSGFVWLVFTGSMYPNLLSSLFSCCIFHLLRNRFLRYVSHFFSFWFPFLFFPFAFRSKMLRTSNLYIVFFRFYLHLSSVTCHSKELRNYKRKLFCVCHKNRRKHNQHFKTAVFHNKFTLRHIKPSIYI